MSKVYVGTIGLDIILDTGRSLSEALVTNIKAKTPSGTEIDWVGVVYDTKKIKYTTVANDLDEPGSYILQAYIVLYSGFVGRGDSVRLKVETQFK